jgi:PAS domain S-box-containing protein
MMSVPLLSQDQVIGVLHFRSTRLGAYTEKDVKLAESIAAQIAGAMANAQLFAQRKRAEEALRRSEEEAKRLAQENAIMAEIGQIISSTLNIEEVYERFAEAARKLIQFERIAVNIVNPSDRTLAITYVMGPNVAEREAGKVVPLAGTAAEWVWQNRSSLLILEENWEETISRFPGLSPLYRAGHRSMMFTPLTSKDQVFGVLNIQTAGRNAYTERDLRLAEKVSTQIAGALANAQLFAQRKRAEEALQSSEEKYRLLIQNSNDAIFIAQDGVIKFPNFKAEELLGYSAAELTQIPFVNHIHPDDREMVAQRHKQRLEGQKPPSTYSLRAINRLDEELWVEINSVFIQWEGRPATLNFMRDVTENRKLEAQFLQAQKMEAVGTLAGGIAHDFNNLLMGIQGHTSLMILDLDPSHRHYKMLKSMEEQVKSGADLTWQLLSFARGGKNEVKPTDLNTIIKKSSSMFGRAKKEISIVQNLQPDLWPVEADRGQIEQVLLNLYVNAWQAMPSGGSLFLETKNIVLDENYVQPFNVKSGNYVKISVTDTGVGMDEKTRKRIFEPFFTTKEMGRGTGLGLATVYGIITGHGGFINVYSQKGHGATFTIYLPASEKKVEKEKKPSSQLLKGTETILLVDDEEVVVNVSRMLLEALGYKVFMARSGQEALVVYEARKGEIDLVIMDMIMPGMGGENTIDILKTMNPDLKVILSSGYSLDGQATRIMERGCQGFIQKPFSARELSQKIREVLGKGTKDHPEPDKAVPG